jgi:O-antigen/teichoic acid export membrane protein
MMVFRPLLQRVIRSEFARSSALVFAGVIVGNAVNFGFLLLAGRLLSVVDYGIVISLISGIMLVHAAGAALQTVTAKLSADLHAVGDEAHMSAFARSVSRLSLLVTASVSIVIVAFQRPIADYLHLEHSSYVAISGIATGAGFAILFQRGCMQGFGDFRSYALSSVLDGIRTIVIVPLTMWLGVAGSLIAMLFGVVSVATYGEIVLFRRFASVAAAAVLDTRRMAKTALATASASLGIAFLMYYDVVLARHFLSATDAGLYGAASLAGRVVSTVIAFLPAVLLPYVAARSKREERTAHVFIVAIAAAITVVAPAALFAALAPSFIVHVMAGKNFGGADALVLPYVAAAGFLSLANVLASYAIGRHRFGFVPFVLITGAIEVAAVFVRHASAMDVVQDVLAGHLAVCCVMALWLIAGKVAPRGSRTAAAGAGA